MTSIVYRLVAHAEITATSATFLPDAIRSRYPASELRWVPPRYADLLLGVIGMSNQTTRLHRSGRTLGLNLTRFALQVFGWIEWSSFSLQALSTRR